MLLLHVSRKKQAKRITNRDIDVDVIIPQNNDIDIDLECHFEVFTFCIISVLMLFTCIFVTSIDQSIFKLKILICLEHDQLNGNFITRFRRMHIIDRSQKK